MSNHDAIAVPVVHRLNLYWHHRGMTMEWERWSREALAVADLDPFVRLTIEINLGLAATMAGGDALRTALTRIDAYQGPLTFDQQRIMALGLYAMGTFGVVMGAPDVLPEAAQRILIIAGKTGNSFDELLGRNLLLMLRLDGAPGVVLRDAEDIYRETYAAGSVVALATAMIATLAAVADRALEAGWRWSRRCVDYHLRLGVGGLSGTLELRAALHSLAGEHLEAVRVFATSEAVARHAGDRWPQYPMAEAMSAHSRTQLTAADLDAALREGRTLTLADIADAPGPVPH